LNDICQGTKSALATVGNAFKTGFSKVKGFFTNPFGKRKKRETGCGIGSFVPKINLDVPEISMEALKEFAKSKL
jgi:hypothetical protein